MQQNRHLFLDVDGVLVTERSVIANGIARAGNPETWSNVDQVSVGLIRKLAERYNLSIVLSSTWRQMASYEDLAKAWSLPIVGATPVYQGGIRRVSEILGYMEDRSLLGCDYVVVDDMRMNHFGDRMITTQYTNGFLSDHYFMIAAYFGD